MDFDPYILWKFNKLIDSNHDNGQKVLYKLIRTRTVIRTHTKYWFINRSLMWNYTTTNRFSKWKYWNIKWMVSMINVCRKCQLIDSNFYYVIPHILLPPYSTYAVRKKRKSLSMFLNQQLCSILNDKIFNRSKKKKEVKREEKKNRVWICLCFFFPSHFQISFIFLDGLLVCCLRFERQRPKQ